MHTLKRPSGPDDASLPSRALRVAQSGANADGQGMGVSQALPRKGSDRRPMKTHIRSAHVSRLDLLAEVVSADRIGVASSTSQ